MSKLKAILKEKGISQVQVANALGVTKGAVNAHVKNGIRNIEVAKRYAAILDVSWMKLIG
ncbi:MAG: helix-turn-helix transcriptional regulator [Lentisphaeria bacterium]|nr:helix-turn-helix transcriptional regulator [Lentisphaeria bacterium]